MIKKGPSKNPGKETFVPILHEWYKSKKLVDKPYLIYFSAPFVPSI